MIKRTADILVIANDCYSRRRLHHSHHYFEDGHFVQNCECFRGFLLQNSLHRTLANSLLAFLHDTSFRLGFLQSLIEKRRNV